MDEATSGGQGGSLPASLAPGPGQTSDTRLLERAIRQRWPIKDRTREAVIRRLELTVASPASSPREATAAARALIAADALNLQQEAPQQHEHKHIHAIADPDERRRRISSIAQRLGIDGPVVVDGEVISSTHPD